jgi:hypothetical protein
MNDDTKTAATNWQIMKAMAELAQAFPILDTVFDVHQIDESGNCGECNQTGRYASWPCRTVWSVLDRAGVL